MRNTVRLVLLVIACLFTLSHGDPPQFSAAAKKDLIIVLGGMLGSAGQVERVAACLDTFPGFDARAVRFKSRAGLAACRRNLRQQLSAINYYDYAKVHFFCFILGGVTLREVLPALAIPNPGSIVLVRGPFEETVASAAPYAYPAWVIKLTYGNEPFDLAMVRYADFPDCGFGFGMLIETVPNKLAVGVATRLRRAYGGDDLIPTWLTPDSLMQGYRDFAYIALDHNQMYDHPDRYAAMAATFYRTRNFGPLAQRAVPAPMVRLFPRWRR
jgi:hypothetical protein